MIGTTHGPYRVTASLGAGGMGEVYRADDTRLGRQVAIKVLPEAFTADAERLARFEREARVLASLNHPGIAQVYGLEESAGRRLLVMELVEGEELASRIARGPIPPDEVREMAIQIAEALEAAHEKGIVHRDLKPANIKVLPDGSVKVLDFGLAKAREESSDVLDSATPTRGIEGTEPGAILGTAPYMSPEQARGRPIDRRTDVWAFGVVLWEMLTGRRLFSGPTMSDVLASVLQGAIDLEALPAATPPTLRRVVEHALRRDLKTRWQWIGDARLELQEAPDRPEVARPATRSRRGWLGLAAGLAIGLVIGSLLAFARSRRPDPHPNLVLNLAPPKGLVFNAVDGPPELSHDGKKVAFLAAEAGKPSEIWVRSFEEAAAHRVEGTLGAAMPFWSPNDRSLGFFSGGKLRRVDLAGGAPEPLADVAFPGGGAWSADGTIVFVRSIKSPPYAVSATGGDARPLPAPFPRRTNPWYVWPELLPDGKHYLFAFQDLEGPKSGIVVASLDGSEEAKVLTRTTGRPWFVSPNWILFWEKGRIVAHRFDLERLEMDPKETVVVDGVGWGQYNTYGRFTISANGPLLYQPGNRNIGDTELVVVDRQGKELEVVGERAEYYSPRLSWAGTKLAVDVTDIQSTMGDVWVFDLERKTRISIAAGPLDESSPVWMRDDRRLAYRRVPNLYRRDAEAAGPEKLLIDSTPSKTPADVSPDGAVLLYVARIGEDNQDLWSLELANGTTKAWLEGPEAEDSPRFSPDGHWVAYQSNESGHFEVSVRSFPDAHERFVVSVDGGLSPVWRRDGRELFYRTTDGNVMAVAVDWSGGRPHFGRPFVLFAVRLRQEMSTEFDVFPDGRRFLLNRVIAETDDEPLVFIENWRRLLKE